MGDSESPALLELGLEGRGQGKLAPADSSVVWEDGAQTGQHLAQARGTWGRWRTGSCPQVTCVAVRAELQLLRATL